MGPRPRPSAVSTRRPATTRCGRVDRRHRLGAGQRRRGARRTVARPAAGRDDAAVREHAVRSAQRQGVHRATRRSSTARAPTSRRSIPTTPFNYRARLGLPAADVGPVEPGQRHLHAATPSRSTRRTTSRRSAARRSSSATTRRPSRSDRSTRRRSAATRPAPNFGWALTPKVNGAATCKIPPYGRAGLDRLGPLQPVVYGDARTRHRRRVSRLLEHAPAAGGHFIFDWSTPGQRRAHDRLADHRRLQPRRRRRQPVLQRHGRGRA